MKTGISRTKAMADAMREKVARAICRARQWNEDGFWKTASSDAGAALEACCYEELVTALRPFAEFGHNMRGLRKEFVITQGSSMARRQLTAGDCKAAFAVLAKVEASDA